MARERLQKIIARSGLCSRRDAEELIENGRVRVAGRIVTELGFKADARSDVIEVDGKRLARPPLLYIVLHKPRGYVTTLEDPEGRPTVAELVRDVGERLFPVGRLDYATSGVLIMSNDGEFSQALLHPKSKVPKTYVVKLDRELDQNGLEAWRTGIELDDGHVTAPAEVRLLRYESGKTWLEVTLYEGKNQQIRRMAAATGMIAMRLARVAFAGIAGEGVRPGQWRPLSVDELKKLQRTYGVPKRVRPPQSPAATSERKQRGQKPAAATTVRAPRGARQAPRSKKRRR
jgi:23S rRNA pseudouridine2605 synthase